MNKDQEQNDLLQHLLHTTITSSPPNTTYHPPHAAPPQPLVTQQSSIVTLLQWLLVGLAMLMMILMLWLMGVLLQANQDLDAMIVMPGETATPVLMAAELAQTDADVEPAETPVPTSTPYTVPTPFPTALPTPPPAAAIEATHILLLGIDRRPDEPPGEPSRTDSIMLVRIEPNTPRISLLSLPRDLWVTIPGYLPNRLNHAYLVGETYAPGTGLQVARAAVTNLTGVQIDHVVLMDFSAFVGLVNALGGVTVNVEKELYDDKFPTIDYGYTTVHFLPGPQTMDGLAALTYSRIRHPDNDFFRIQRQQQVMIAIGERLRERGDLETLFTVDQITGALRGYLITDMSKERMVGLIWHLRSYDTFAVERYSVTSDMVVAGVGNDRYALVPLMPQLNGLVTAFLGDV